MVSFALSLIFWHDCVDVNHEQGEGSVKELINLGVSGAHAQTETCEDSVVNPKWVRFDKIQ